MAIEQPESFTSFDGDQTNEFANKAKYVIEFYHIATGKSVRFKAMLTEFSDNYDSQWSSEEVYGRMDPIKTFKTTIRTITLAWDVVAGSQEEAVENMINCSTLFQMLYPTYASAGSSSTLQAPPLFKLKLLNLIQDVSRAPAPGKHASAKAAGLVGSVSGFKYSPNLDHGVFAEGQGTVYPQSLNLSCTFSCMHTHPLGYGPDGELRNKKGSFPYNVKRKETPTQAGGNTTTAAPAASTRHQQHQEERLTSEQKGDGVSSQPK
jgi:hypothetical protein